MRGSRRIRRIRRVITASGSENTAPTEPRHAVCRFVGRISGAEGRGGDKVCVPLLADGWCWRGLIRSESERGLCRAFGVVGDKVLARPPGWVYDGARGFGVVREMAFLRAWEFGASI